MWRVVDDRISLAGNRPASESALPSPVIGNDGHRPSSSRTMPMPRPPEATNVPADAKPA